MLVARTTGDLTLIEEIKAARLCMLQGLASVTHPFSHRTNIPSGPLRRPAFRSQSRLIIAIVVLCRQNLIVYFGITSVLKGMHEGVRDWWRVRRARFKGSIEFLTVGGTYVESLLFGASICLHDRFHSTHVRADATRASRRADLQHRPEGGPAGRFAAKHPLRFPGECRRTPL